MRNTQPLGLQLDRRYLTFSATFRDRDFIIEDEIDNIQIQVESQVISLLSPLPPFDPSLG